MGSAVYINIAIVVLTVFGFVMTTYRDKLAALPDRIENPVLAAGFGITGLVGTFMVLGAASLILVNALIMVLAGLNVL